MSGAPRVSVVIPVQNGERYLAAAIEGALAQTHAPAQVIVVDDGSTDASAAIAASFAPRVRCLARPVSGGGAAARNDGVALASGEYLAFLDADDLWPPQRLERLLAAFAQQPEADIVFGQVQEFRDGAAPDPPRAAPLATAALIARPAWDRVGGLGDWAVGEFLDWLLRAREVGLHEITVPDTVLLRRLHESNHSTRRRAEFGEYARVLKASLDRRRADEAARP